MTLKTRWLLIGLLLALPYLVLGGVGICWLLEHGYWWWWVAAMAASTVVGWMGLHRLSRRPAALDVPVSPDGNWSKSGQAAWSDIERLAASANAQNTDWQNPEAVIALLREVLATVAIRFYPKSREPLYDVPIPHVLRIVELVAQDLRRAISTRIPGSHILTINDLQRLQRLAAWAPSLYRLYRIAALIVSPSTALARELNLYLQEEVVEASKSETRRWLMQFVIRQAGYYAIELYSGNLVLEDVEFGPFTSARSRAALTREELRDAALADEPLRVLVLGQVKAGKSSLINALFGETKAAVDVVPRTRHIEPYQLERDGLPQAVILDTAGYEELRNPGDALLEARGEVLQSDLILLVCHALSAARQPDRKLLDELRAMFQADPDREFPPLLVVLTHIDQVRPPREWDPPYNLLTAEQPKARNIRDAIEAISADLNVPAAQIVPVCLVPDRLYNIDDALVPAIIDALPSAQRLRYLRCLREFREESHWRQLQVQARSTGRILAETGAHLLREATRTLDDLGQSLFKPPT